MKTGILFTLIIFIGGCGTTSKVNTLTNVSEGNKDVFILSTLIRDHLRKTKERDLNLDEIFQNDTLRRITNNFEKVELKPRAGHIAVYYKFSDSRDNKIELTDKEREMINILRWDEKRLKGQHDGEIQFDYGERSYRIRKVVVKKR